MINIIITIVGIVVGAIVSPKIYALYVNKTKPLEIKPANKKILVSKGEIDWTEEFYIYLINHSDNPYYDITIISKFPKGLNVSILPEKSNVVSLGTKENRISMGVDFMLGLENKERSNEVTQTVINNIDPNETKKVKVLIKREGYKGGFDVKFVLGNFSKLPKPIMTKF